MVIQVKIPPKITIKDHGSTISADIDIINFSGNLGVTDDGNGQVTVDTRRMKAGLVSAGSFTGDPRTATVTFSTAFPDTSYTITITGVDSRVWSYQSKTTSGFVINANSKTALTGEVSWQAIRVGE